MKNITLRAAPMAGSVLIVALATITLQSQEKPACVNISGDISDYINTQCASCLQNPDNTWSTLPKNSGGTCGGTVYEEKVANDIDCGYNPVPVYIWGRGVLLKNTRKATLSGNCLNGSCGGTRGAWSTTVYLMSVYDGNLCPTNYP